MKLLTCCGALLSLVADSSLHAQEVESKETIPAVAGSATGAKATGTAMKPIDASALKKELAACQKKTAQLKKKIKVMVARAKSRKAQLRELQDELEKARQRPAMAPAELQKMVVRLRSAEKRLDAVLDELEKIVNN